MRSPKRRLIAFAIGAAFAVLKSVAAPFFAAHHIF
jgi:hypothetical protein